MEALGWILLVLPLLIGGYAFVLYPLIMRLWAGLQPSPSTIADPSQWPTVTVLIVAFNEVRRLRPTIDKILQSDYPTDRLDVLVVSDASSDGTDELVTSMQNPRVRLLRMPERKGKAAGENASGAHISSEIVLSIDASILVPPASVKNLIRAMSEPGVGLASGRDISVGDESREGNQAESSYVGLEMKLREFETRVGSIVGASGCFYATRRELHLEQLPEEMSRDFAAASVARRAGFRAVSVDSATCLVPRTSSLRAEFRRKSRTMGRGLDTLFFLRGMMNPFRFGRYAFMMASHKLMRWLFFPAFFGWIFGPLFLIERFPAALLLTLMMLVGIALAIVTTRIPADGRMPSILAFPSYVFVSIVAGWMAWWHLISGQKSATWEPTQRPVVNVSAT